MQSSLSGAALIVVSRYGHVIDSRWAGVVPLRTVAEPAVPNPGLGSVLGVGVYIGILAACLGLGWFFFSRPG
ncbi:MAG: hypothetical protein JWN96_984 [Mycobacterium sp.]|nr:hypothetical protein [Mycobacterium sp.]